MLKRYAPLAQLDRASGYGPEGREFESLTAYQRRSKVRFASTFFFYKKRHPLRFLASPSPIETHVVGLSLGSVMLLLLHLFYLDKKTFISCGFARAGPLDIFINMSTFQLPLASYWSFVDIRDLSSFLKSCQKIFINIYQRHFFNH